MRSRRTDGQKRYICNSPTAHEIPARPSTRQNGPEGGGARADDSDLGAHASGAGVWLGIRF